MKEEVLLFQLEGVRFQRNEEIVPNRDSDKTIGEANPPPYAMVHEPSAPQRAATPGRTDSTISVDRRYDPYQLLEDRQRMMEVVRGECNLGQVVERGRRMKD